MDFDSLVKLSSWFSTSGILLQNSSKVSNSYILYNRYIVYLLLDYFVFISGLDN